MNLDDAKALWSSDNEPTDPDMSTQSLSQSELLQQVKAQSAAFDRTIRQRDWTESVAAAAVSVFFGWLAWHDPSTLVTAGALLVVAGSALIFGRLRYARTRFTAPSANEPVRQRLERERAKVDAQIRLLSSVLWWYIAPLLAGLLLMTVGDNGWSVFTVVYGTGAIAGAAAIYVINQRAVARDLRPRRETLTHLLNQVDSSADTQNDEAR
jgi:MFS family permease